MESLGNVLRAAREERGYSFDYVSRETNISSRYLEALEQEDFSCFPGEPYVLGFLKTYGAYLDLSPNEVLSLYRSHKIQEQPLPMEQLLKGPSQTPKIIKTVLIALAVLGLAGGAVWFFIFRVPNDASGEIPAARVPVEYTLTIGALERRFYIGDTVLVSLENNLYKLELSNLGDAVNITTPQGIKILDLGHEAVLDLTGSGLPELKMIVADFSKTDANAGALLRFELDTFQAFAPDSDLAGLDINTRVTGLQGATVIIPSSGDAYPFTLQLTFLGYCYFRWEIIAERDRPGRNDGYFQRSDERSITANNGIRIGISNAQAARASIIAAGRTYSLELGGPGEVVVADIRWVREGDRARLVLVHLE